MSQISLHRAGEAIPSGRTSYLRHLELFAGTIYAICLVVFSIFLFMVSATSEQVNNLITEQNAAALKLWTNLDYYQHHRAYQQGADTSLPPGLYEDVVEFSRQTATLMKTVHRLNWKNFFSSTSQPRPLPKFHRIDFEGSPSGYFDHTGVNPNTDTKAGDIVKQGMYQIELYQAIRDYAQDKANFYIDILGAISVYLLPVLYSLLGAFLYALRSSRSAGQHQQIVWSRAQASRFLMAGIAGITVGAFNALIPKEVLLSPLAIAFVVGYSIEVFISVLDRYIRKYEKPVPQ
jgi:hypothetical protein